jgi:thiol-disulfide isomerase/thioredoxin
MVQFNNAISEATSQDLPVVVDFSASWCGPCKRIAPLFAEMAGSYKGKMTFIKVDGDKCRDISEKHSVTGFPTFCFYDRGELQHAETFSGADADRLRRTVASMADAAEVRRENARKLKFVHFPLREEERVLHRSIAWDRVTDKVASLCQSNPELAGEMEVSLFLKSVQELSSLFGDVSLSMSSMEPAHVQALNTLVGW